MGAGEAVYVGGGCKIVRRQRRKQWRINLADLVIGGILII